MQDERGGNGLRHALAYADDLHRWCVKGSMGTWDAAERLGLDYYQTVGVLSLTRYRWPLPVERLATVLMLDWGMDDADVAEVFGRSERWASLVREQQDEIRALFPIPLAVEQRAAEIHSDDVPPDELWERAKSLRQRGLTHGQCIPWSVPQFNRFLQAISESAP